MPLRWAFAFVLATTVGAVPVAADTVYLTYQIEASLFEDSNGESPPFPTSNSVSGIVAFAIDDAIGSGLEQNNIVPLWVSGLDITDNQGDIFDYDETNTAVDVERFTQSAINSGRAVFGGTFNTNDFLAGGSNDFRVGFWFNLTTYLPGSVFEAFTFVTDAFDSEVATSTVVTLLGVSSSPPSPVPIPAALSLIAPGVLFLTRFRRRTAA